MATSTPANANSPASISPVGPPPTMTTACLVIATLQSSSSSRRSTRPRATSTSTTIHSCRDPVGSGFVRRFYGMTRVLKQVPWALHIRLGGTLFVSAVSAVMAATNRTYKLEAPTPDRGSRGRDPIPSVLAQGNLKCPEILLPQTTSLWDG